MCFINWGKNYTFSYDLSTMCMVIKLWNNAVFSNRLSFFAKYAPNQKKKKKKKKKLENFMYN